MFQVIREFPFEFPYNYDYLPIIILSYIGFMFVYTVVAPKLSKKISTSYSNLNSAQKLEWNVRFTSTIFSIVVSIVCIYVLVVDHAIALSPLIYDSPLVKTNLAIVMGYIISDMTIIIANYRVIGDAFTLAHHIATVFGYAHSLTYSVMPYFANFRLIVELSTPLVNMRWFFYAAGYNKYSLCFFINGIVMTLLFFTVRIAIIPLYWYKVYTVLESPLWIKMRHFRYVMIFTCVLLDIINIYWFKKMFRGAVMVFQSNWQYYEKHHKTQQIETILFYRNQLMNAILSANNLVCESTKQGLNKINPSRYIDFRLSEHAFMPRILAELLNRNGD